jgi:hypothetical protein
MDSDKRWLTFREAAERIARAHSSSGRSREAQRRDAVLKLWRGYWYTEFPRDALRGVLETALSLDPKRYRPTPEGARPELLIRLVGGGRHFLEDWFLEIEISESELTRWRRWRAAGSRDNGRSLLRQWLVKKIPKRNTAPTQAELYALAKPFIRNLSRRASNDIWRELIAGGPGRPRKQGPLSRASTHQK